MIRSVLIASAALFAVACSQPAPEPAPQTPAEVAEAMPQSKEEATAQDTCGASQYASLIGSNFAAVTLPAEANVRIIQPDSVVTQDFRADRANIVVDANGAITAVECY